MASSSSGVEAAWGKLGVSGRWALSIGAVLIVALGIWLGVALLATDYRTLFADLSPRDAATIVEQLKQNKVKYQLASGGTTIFVPTNQAHDVRLQPMPSHPPLS